MNPGLQIVALAASRIGCPYVYGAAGPNAFDCSGLLVWVMGQLGVTLPHGSADQFWGYPHVTGPLLVGDAVFFQGGEASGPRPGHVGIFDGTFTANHDPYMIDAPYTGAPVRYDVFDPSLTYGPGAYYGAVRFASLVPQTQEPADMYLVTLATGNPTEPIYLLSSGTKHHLSPAELAIYTALGLSVTKLPADMAADLAAIREV